jgi:hypothetical protein
MSEKLYVAILNTSSGYFLMCADDGNVHGFESLRRGVDYFEKGYEDGHNRGRESSASATLSWLTTQPSIIEVDGMEGIRALLKISPENKVTRVRLRNIAGSFLAITMDPEKAKIAYDGGIQPNIM